jgi:hypothetical protein
MKLDMILCLGFVACFLFRFVFLRKRNSGSESVVFGRRGRLIDTAGEIRCPIHNTERILLFGN